MTQRAYTLDEIDGMRRAIFYLRTAGQLFGGGLSGDQRRDMERTTEERLRTYMLGGIDPEELQERVRARAKELEGTKIYRGGG